MVSRESDWSQELVAPKTMIATLNNAQTMPANIGNFDALRGSPYAGVELLKKELSMTEDGGPGGRGGTGTDTCSLPCN